MLESISFNRNQNILLLEITSKKTIKSYQKLKNAILTDLYKLINFQNIKG